MTFVIEAMSPDAFDEYSAALASGSPPPATDGGECEVTIEIAANNLQFDIDAFEVPADTPFCIAFENQENQPHNVAIYDGGDALFSGEILSEPGSVTYQVPALPAGEFRFICEVHPDMAGDVTVTQ
jgi:plastocyanin